MRSLQASAQRDPCTQTARAIRAFLVEKTTSACSARAKRTRKRERDFCACVARFPARFAKNAGALTTSRTKKGVSAALLFLRVSMNVLVSHLPNERTECGAHHPSARVKRQAKFIAMTPMAGAERSEKAPTIASAKDTAVRSFPRTSRTASLRAVRTRGQRTPSAGIPWMSSEPPARTDRWLSERGMCRAQFERGPHQSRRRLVDVAGCTQGD